LSTSVLDASSLLAYVHDEEGAAEIEEALARRATIGAANLAEALSMLAHVGVAPQDVVAELQGRGVLGGLLEVEPLTSEDAVAIAELRPPTKDYGLGLGDRACLALGLRLGLPVITADRVWVELEDVLGIKIHAFRG
jgi:PIN domain nuclease of toxin-antitoxin system